MSHKALTVQDRKLVSRARARCCLFTLLVALLPLSLLISVSANSGLSLFDGIMVLVLLVPTGIFAYSALSYHRDLASGQAVVIHGLLIGKPSSSRYGPLLSVEGVPIRTPAMDWRQSLGTPLLPGIRVTVEILPYSGATLRIVTGCAA